MDKTETSHCLEMWHEGDRRGLELLVERHLPWIRDQVHQRMGPILRSKAETTDLVQDSILQFLQYGPRFKISNDAHFRGLMFKVVMNTIYKKMDWFTARRRQIALERPLASDTILSFDPPKSYDKTPSQSVDRHEREAWVRMGMEFLEPEAREILVLRKWDNLPFDDIGTRLGIKPDAARMRYNRALGRLGSKICALRMGKLEKVIAESIT